MPVTNELLSVVCGLSGIIAAIAWLYAYRCWDFCKDTEEFIKLQNKRSVTLAKLTEIETQITELTDSYDALMRSHKKLRSRIGMRNVRAANGHSDGQIPDSQTDPAGFKRAMRLKLGAGQLK